MPLNMCRIVSQIDFVFFSRDDTVVFLLVSGRFSVRSVEGGETRDHHPRRDQS